MEINKNYKLVQGNECLSVSLGNYFNYEYPFITANEIIILGGGLDIIYDSESNIIGSKMYESNFNFLNRYGIDYKHDKFQSKKEALQGLQQAIKKQKKIIIKVQAERLPYSRVFQQANNAPHFINVLGVKEEQIYLCDGYIPNAEVSTYEGWVNYNNIMDAWRGMGYEYIILNDISILNHGISKDEWKTYMIEGLNLYLKGGKTGNMYFGQDAIIKLFDDLVTKSKEENLREYILNMNYQLRIYGFLPVKQVICDSIYHNLNKKIDITEYKALLEEWNHLCRLLVKCAFSKKDNLIDEVYKKMKEIIKRENTNIKNIIYYIDETI